MPTLPSSDGGAAAILFWNFPWLPGPTFEPTSVESDVSIGSWLLGLLHSVSETVLLGGLATALGVVVVAALTTPL